MDAMTHRMIQLSTVSTKPSLKRDILRPAAAADQDQHETEKAGQEGRRWQTPASHHCGLTMIGDQRAET
jgi:hypothetical protein